jgi:hypothetical protein
MLVLLDFVQIVPVALPHLYVIVCVKLESYLLTVNVCAVFKVPFDAAKLLFLAIVFSVPLPDPDFVPMFVPVNVIENSWLNEYENVFVPFELWVIVVEPLANVFVVLLLIPTVFEPLYFVPFTVTDHLFEAVESILPELPEISCSFQLIVEVLFATDWLVTSQLNFKVSHDVTVTLALPLVAIMNHPQHIHNLHFHFRLGLSSSQTGSSFL